jgi:hypothetical protein
MAGSPKAFKVANITGPEKQYFPLEKNRVSTTENLLDVNPWTLKGARRISSKRFPGNDRNLLELLPNRDIQ